MSCRPCRVEANFRSAVSPPPSGPSSTRTYIRAACIGFCVRARSPASMNASSDLATCLISYPTNAASCSLVSNARGCRCRNISKSRSHAWRTTRICARRRTISWECSSDDLGLEMVPPLPPRPKEHGAGFREGLGNHERTTSPIGNQDTFPQDQYWVAGHEILKVQNLALGFLGNPGWTEQRLQARSRWKPPASSFLARYENPPLINCISFSKGISAADVTGR